MSERRSILGLDEETPFFHKLGLFLSTLFIVPLVGLLLFAGIHSLDEPWRSVAEFLLETIAVFWLLALIFIWWRPAWLRRFYLAVERKLVLFVQAAVLIAVVLIGVALLLEFLRSQGILV